MAYEMRPGSGNMFNNDYKETDRHPDLKGKIMTPDGQEWDVAGWWKDGRNGQFLSLNVQEPYRRPGEYNEQPRGRESAGPRRLSEEEFQRLRQQRQQGYGQQAPRGGGSPARGGASGGGYGQTQRPPSARPGEVPGHSLPPMDDFSDDDIPF
ncbi:hypothetical protein [Stenotrophomonas phage BUCT555]|nr:hypothetical protein [Stenotrophomonas phage BUCT555]